MGVKFQGRTIERTPSGTTNVVVHQGSREDMEATAAEHPAGLNGVRSTQVRQVSGKIWECEVRTGSDSGGGVIDIVGPDAAYGALSAQLRGSMLSLPLEAHPNYRARWNHMLATPPAMLIVDPAWWENAKDTIIPSADSKKFAWVKSNAELRTTPDGDPWIILKPMDKPGVQTYDMAVYSITEAAKFQTAKAAGSMVANSLSKISKPSNDFGITNGNWKCDDAVVAWTGEYWLATLTWTLSGNPKGWDTDLYSKK